MFESKWRVFNIHLWAEIEGSERVREFTSLQLEVAPSMSRLHDVWHITTSGIFHRIRDILKDNARVLGNSCFHQLPMPRCTLMSCQGRTYASSNRGSGCAHCVAYAIILCYPVNRTQFRSLMILIHTFDVTWLITRRTSSVCRRHVKLTLRTGRAAGAKASTEIKAAEAAKTARTVCLENILKCNIIE